MENNIVYEEMNYEEFKQKREELGMSNESNLQESR